MNKSDKIIYLNNRLTNKDPFVYVGPKALYKYRPFDEYTFEMLNSGTVFLCPAKNLDDETECDALVNLPDLVELNTNNLKRICLEKIIQMIKPYCSDEVYEEIRWKIYRASNGDGTMREHFLVDISPEIQDAVSGIDTTQIINWIRDIPEMLDNPSSRPQIENLIQIAVDAKEKMGICSLCESVDIDDMWERYADNNQGYCIEYEMDDYELNQSLFPVIYDANRETNVVMTIVGDFIAQTIMGISNNQIHVDSSQYLRLFLSKYPKWEYQNEWRILGDAGTKLKAPKIRRIILGNKVSTENKITMNEYCEKNSIDLVER